jgi:hypothetical protein
MGAVARGTKHEPVYLGHKILYQKIHNLTIRHMLHAAMDLVGQLRAERRRAATSTPRAGEAQLRKRSNQYVKVNLVLCQSC